MRSAWNIYFLLIVWLFSLLLILVLAGGFTLWDRYVTVTLSPTSNESSYFLVPRGASVSRIAQQLEQEGLVTDARGLVWMARLTGQANRIRAGEYRISPGMSLSTLLDDMVAGRVVLHSITIPEGVTFAQFRERIAAAEGLHHTVTDLDDRELLAQLGIEHEHPEGWFFPDTYQYQRGDSDIEIYRQAHQAMVELLEQAWAQRDKSIPLSDPYEALILASIIEKETGLPDERAKIAGVFINRLNRGMRLQTDPTVIYGLGENYRGTLYRSDLERDTPYNTYTRAGLPPTPIALPGRAAIEAAVRPEKTDALYFVSDAKGGHVFSRTLNEHNRAVQAYRRALREQAQ